ncbi:hypothetical protein RND81_03G171700 [Saponaria officinalis]|uniref:Methyltransferase n=1 Tax=Saponaria officinalis TaxID=3572 RepID=A0AAW1MBE6_SAPOF
MKLPLINGVSDLLKSPFFLKICIFIFISFSAFFLGLRWSDVGAAAFFSSSSYPAASSSTTAVASSISLSPNLHKSFNLSSATTSPPSPPPPRTAAPLRRFGILDENGSMTDDFEIGEYDHTAVDDLRNITSADSKENSRVRVRVRVSRFSICPESMREYIPCMDNVEAIKKLNSTEKGEKFERHCPESGKELNCLVPPPKNYKSPIPWPRSRDEVWYFNVPHTRLVEDKGGQNWMTRDKDKFKFPGGGTQFIHGANQYLDQISQMVSAVAFGRHTHVVLDVGCGVASFGAYLMSRNVTTLSIAPKDVHENQIQFALERGVPAMVAAFSTRRLPFPSQAFDMIHCSRCRVNWTRDDGILLLEVNRMLRAGGYFTWAAQPVYKHEPILEEQWKEMVNLTTRLCWELVRKEGYIAIWQKPLNNTCYFSREVGTHPPICNTDDDPDNVWYVNLKPCIARLPETGYGGNVTNWPERLVTPPERLQSIQIDAYISRKELFKAESKYWDEIIDGYVRIWHWKKIGLRNVLDMRAGYGGFAAALINNGVDCWVMNVVPVSGPNTLPVIYDRGLIGVMHDWCEPFDTYPRTYDLLHASGLFAAEQKRCNVSSIILEMDRMLRPGGHVYIRDTVSVVEEIQEIAKAMGWHVAVHDTSEGPHSSFKILTCDKQISRR